jgi:hypothetical protein
MLGMSHNQTSDAQNVGHTAKQWNMYEYIASGSLSFCSVNSGDWYCTSVPVEPQLHKMAGYVTHSAYNLGHEHVPDLTGTS